MDGRYSIRLAGHRGDFAHQSIGHLAGSPEACRRGSNFWIAAWVSGSDRAGRLNCHSLIPTTPLTEATRREFGSVADGSMRERRHRAGRSHNAVGAGGGRRNGGGAAAGAHRLTRWTGGGFVSSGLTSIGRPFRRGPPPDRPWPRQRIEGRRRCRASHGQRRTLPRHRRRISSGLLKMALAMMR